MKGSVGYFVVVNVVLLLFLLLFCFVLFCFVVVNIVGGGDGDAGGGADRLEAC